MRNKTKFTISLIMLFTILIGCLGIANISKTNIQSVSAVECANPFGENGFGTLPIETTKPTEKLKKVYVGGDIIGISMGVKGLIVNGKIPVVTKSGVVEPCANIDIMKGDIIVRVNDIPVLSANDIKNIVKESGVYKVTIDRTGNLIDYNVTAVLDELSNNYRLGLWLKESIDGLGTITYLDKERGRFGSLGHIIADSETGKSYNNVDGKIYNSHVHGLVKGERGKAGEILGSFDKSRWVGKIDKNTDFGLFGTWLGDWKGELVEVATRNMVKPGKAQIMSAISGKMEKYEIEIIKASKQKQDETKGLLLKITDKRLLELTNGILQGMSGSPILQNNRLVGAVTHVFVSDPTKGFGVYVDWMIQK